jgi:hypothetical protein
VITYAENEVINLRSRMETLNKNLQELRGAAEFAAQRLEHARTWEGGDWHYSPLHPVHYRSALTRLRCALKGIV